MQNHLFASVLLNAGARSFEKRDGDIRPEGQTKFFSLKAAHRWKNYKKQLTLFESWGIKGNFIRKGNNFPAKKEFFDN